MKSDKMQRMIMHVHTSPRSGDATLTPGEAVAGADSAGARILLFAEHNRGWTAGELERLAAETGRDITLLGSVEVAHRDAHLIVVGRGTACDWSLSVTEAVRQVHEKDGAVILAHPADLHFQIPPGLAADWGVDAVEVYNARKRCVPQSEWDDWRDLGIGLVAGLDAHRRGDMKKDCHTLVPDWVASETDLIKALRQRLTSPSVTLK